MEFSYMIYFIVIEIILLAIAFWLVYRRNDELHDWIRGMVTAFFCTPCYIGYAVSCPCASANF